MDRVEYHRFTEGYFDNLLAENTTLKGLALLVADYCEDEFCQKVAIQVLDKLERVNAVPRL